MGLPASETVSLSLEFKTGDLVIANEGTHKGKTGTIQSLTDKTCRLKLDNDGNITGNILLESVSFFKKTDGPTRNFETGDIVLVNGGTHKGKKGTIQSLTDKTCRLKLANDGKITGNIPIQSISFFTCKIEDKNNNKANGQIRPSE